MTTVTAPISFLLLQPPKYEHDCESCHYLGRHIADDGEETDLYVHPSPDVSRTVIARFGNEGREYKSGTPFGYGSSASLTEARLRAQARGLATFDVYEAMEYAAKDTPSYDEMVRALVATPEAQGIEDFVLGDVAKAQISLRKAFNQISARYASIYPDHVQRIDCLERRVQRVVQVLYGAEQRTLPFVCVELLDFLYSEEPQANASLEPL